MSELERERHKNAGLERARDDWYQEYNKAHQEWSDAVVHIAALEAERRDYGMKKRREVALLIVKWDKAEATIKRIRQSVVHHKQEAALYNNEREYDCLTAVLRIIDKEED